MSSSAERFHFDGRFGHITTSMANSVIDAAYAAGIQEGRKQALAEVDEAAVDYWKFEIENSAPGIDGERDERWTLTEHDDTRHKATTITAALLTDKEQG